ncbi:MAG: MFS transporter [Polaromonas sp.]|uniref:MFS transporter n=1 Tax=Polaromonas sp. TaxID=1869339 RepID=UPI0027307DCD|nr:MFS transporter [Polaromonas sp.]MDP2450511.1 MFS transporter [Polaromonas sp.]MDP3246510.1 MFS transporter [Polaromonas sp.]MDP3755517.1 MFS transporter [Polaromonas sp.]MDP3825315.1 MFS transporter [Polaromonas sp.]
MKLFPQGVLNEGVRKREVFGWAMYDFANSGYTTVVLTAVFGAYFVGVVAGGADWATLAWTFAISVSSLIVMLTMPAIGAYADLKAAKKRLLALSTVGCVLATAALALAGPGDLWVAVAAVVLSYTFYSYGESLIAAFLPELARDEAMGRVSGWGWSFGYLGGMLALGLGLAYVTAAQSRGEPASAFVPVVMLVTAAIYGLASVVTFALLRERATPTPESSVAAKTVGVKASLHRLAQTWKQARHYRDLRWLLTCCACYQAGISVVITLAAVYAEQVLGFKQADTMLLVFMVNIAAVVGAFAFGYWQDRVGHKRALGVTLAGWMLMTLLAALATGPAMFWVAAVIAGLCMGASQSAGRAMVGLLTPPDRRAEFFGLWSFAIHLSVVIGPLTYGVITLATGGNHRVAILCTSLFFALGLWLLRPIDMARGQRAAREIG